MRRGMAVRTGGAMAIAALFAACSGGGPGATAGGPGATDAGAGATIPVGGIPDGNKPSGAKVRIVNTYYSGTGDPGAVDVYASFSPAAGDKPLITVPYGSVSDFFDPTVSDDAGDGVLAFYPAGVTGDGKDLITQQETFKSGDIWTVYITMGSKRDDGTYGGSTTVFEHHPSGNGVEATPDAGKGLLEVISSGLDNVFTSAASDSWYVGYGQGCEPGLGNTKGGGITTTVNPGQTGAGFDIDPGDHTVSIYSSASDQASDCSGTPIASQPVTARVGETDVLFLYASKDGQLKSLMVPLEP